MAAKLGRSPREFVIDYSRDVAGDFELWAEDVDDFLNISEVTDSEARKRLFLNLAGLGIRRIVKGLVIPTPPSTSGDSTKPSGCVYKALKDAIVSNFRPTTNLTSERHKFRQMRQHDAESVIAFVGRLRAASERCKFSSTDVDSIENCQLRDQLIVGLRSNDIRRELLKSSSLTLAKATTDAVAMESSITDSKLLDPFSVSSLPSSVNKIISVRKYPSSTSSSKKKL